MKNLIKSIPVIAGLLFTVNAKSQNWLLAGNLSTTPPSQYIGTGDAQPLVFKTNGVERARVLSTGNFGVGTTAPGYKLSVQSAIMNDGVQILQTGSTAAGLHLDNSGTNGHNWGVFSNGTSNFEGAGNFSIYDYGIGGSGGGGTRFLINGTTGNVGIGTGIVQPTAKLTVNGNMLIGDPSIVTLPAGYKLYVQTGILTEKVKVAIVNTINWADYVFDKNYKLRPLSEVEAYINNNKHLPEIPSAEEVVKNGIDLAEMDAKLLQKVEELTLYVIRLEKEINNLKQK